MGPWIEDPDGTVGDAIKLMGMDGHYGADITLNKKGDMIGWSTIASPFTYHESAVALTDGEALTIPVEEFLELMQGDSDLGSKITKKVTEIIRQRIVFIKGPLEDEE